MDPYHFTDSYDSESSEDDFTGFNSEELQAALDKRTEWNNRNYSSDESSLSSESDDEIDTDNNSSSSDRDESDDNVDIDNVDPSDVPDLRANPIDWTEDLSDIYVPAFNRPSGPNLPADWNPKSTPLDYFKLFMTDDLLKDIVNQTNQYARIQIAKRCRTQPNYVDQEWPADGSKDLTIAELFAYIGVNVILSVNPFRQLKHVFSSDPYLGNSGIRNVFTLKRFTKIGHYFCVSDKSVEPPRESALYDKLYKIRPVVSKLNELFPKYYNYSEHQVIDESSVKMKSRDQVKMFLKNKPCKFGWKVWSRCDSESPQKPYLLQFEPYLGRKLTKVSEHGLYFDVVNRLTRSLRGSNVKLYTDNAYSSCKLAIFLMGHSIWFSGTARQNSLGLHPYVKAPPKKAPRGSFKIFQDKDKRNLTICCWRDCKWVRFCSTEADPRITCAALRRINGRYERIHQPLVAFKYASRYKNVDIFDMASTKYQIARRSYRPWKYMWNFCLQASIVNAFILYMATNTDPKPRNFTQSQFRLILAKQLIGGFSGRKATPIIAPLFVGPDVVDTDQIVNHENSKMDSARGRTCKIHKQYFRVTKRTVYGCRACGVYLCKECHVKWHYNT